jgi:hypothetical protein
MILDQGPADAAARIKDYVAELGIAATIYQPATKQTIGALRNISVQSASGTILCPWDDDDFSHPTRLAEQYDFLVRENAIAVTLQEVLCLFWHSREMYWMNFRNTISCCHPNTVLFRRDVLSRYPEGRPGEGTALALSLQEHLGDVANHGTVHEDTALMLSLIAEGKVVHMAGVPHLFVYVNHGGNVCTPEFFQKLGQSLGISRGLLERRRKVFNRLDSFDLGEGLITVMGNNGPAFQIPGRSMDVLQDGLP